MTIDDPSLGPTAGPSSAQIASSKARLLLKRGGGPGYTGTYGTAPPRTTYAPHTTIRGSRSSFVVVCVIAGLIFFALLGGGYWYLRRRRRSRLVSGHARANSAGGRKSAIFGRQHGATAGAGSWGRLGDRDDDDPFAATPSANVSMMDLNDPHSLSPELGKGAYSRTYAASGESLHWQPPSLEAGSRDKRDEDDRDEEEKDATYVKV